jgi:hypothetical protein
MAKQIFLLTVINLMLMPFIHIYQKKKAIMLYQKTKRYFLFFAGGGGKKSISKCDV